MRGRRVMPDEQTRMPDLLFETVLKKKMTFYIAGWVEKGGWIGRFRYKFR